LQLVVERHRNIVRENAQSVFTGAGTATAGARIDNPECASVRVGQVPSRASARIGLPGINKLLDSGIVCRSARTLEGDRTVPFEAAEFKCREDFITGARLRARWVNILNTEQPLTVVPARFKEARDSGQ